VSESVSDRIAEVTRRIQAACDRAGRDPREVTLVAVTKTVPPERIREAVAAGVKILGENRVQEAAAKASFVLGGAIWHLVGHLQTNKVKRALTIFDMIQSVDSLALAREIDRRASEAGRRVDVLVEVNTSREASKFGAAPEECVDLVGEMSHFRHISVEGLMTIGAFTSDEGAVRACFRRLRDLRERIQSAKLEGVPMEYLSMGMTSDFEIAIEEGSNMLRIGTAIFGAR
jgi:pyridoxal phosphate enzyme (YggS family)